MQFGAVCSHPGLNKLEIGAHALVPAVHSIRASDSVRVLCVEIALDGDQSILGVRDIVVGNRSIQNLTVRVEPSENDENMTVFLSALTSSTSIEALNFEFSWVGRLFSGRTLEAYAPHVEVQHHNPPPVICMSSRGCRGKERNHQSNAILR